MKKFHLLILGLATLCIISCGNKKDPLEKALELATEASELSESIDNVVESEESSALESVADTKSWHDAPIESVPTECCSYLRSEVE